jgi:hypothetical protein
MFTVHEAQFQQIENGPRALLLPFPELARRVEIRLRVVLSHVLQKESQYRSQGGPMDKTIVSDDTSSPHESPREMEMINALLQRAIIMQRLPSLDVTTLESSEIVHREIANARRDMTVAKLPTLSTAL